LIGSAAQVFDPRTAVSISTERIRLFGGLAPKVVPVTRAAAARLQPVCSCRELASLAIMTEGCFAV
jgi:hypothetical protein